MICRRNLVAISALSLGLALVSGCSLFVDGPKESRLGVCSWSLGVPIDEVAVQMRELGIKKVHLALTPFIAADARHGGSENAEAWKRVKERVASGEWIVTAGMVSFKGEDYSTLESIKRTGGIVPDENWEFNRMLVEKGAALTKELGAKYLSCHAGFLDVNDAAAYAKYRSRVQEMADICTAKGVMLILETGQETAEHLAAFLKTVKNVGVNLDPANMILYAKGDPVEAVRTLAPWIRHVHLKDANLTKDPGTWGTEVPLGDGQIGLYDFLKALRSNWYRGDFAIEREAGNTRFKDISLAARRFREASVF